MGWTGTHRPSGMSDREFFTQEYQGVTILEACRRGWDCIWLKCERFEPDGTRHCFIVHVECHWAPNSHWNFTYKDCDESMGPYRVDCPLSYLDGLTEPVNEYSADWRKRVREHHAGRKPRPKPGQKIKLASPLRFSNGETLDTFEVVRHGKAGIAFRAGYTTYKISRIQEREFELV